MVCQHIVYFISKNLRPRLQNIQQFHIDQYEKRYIMVQQRIVVEEKALKSAFFEDLIEEKYEDP
ncbi:hypothetical protein PT2222_140405 [Paraburkholderia tropica]